MATTLIRLKEYIDYKELSLRSFEASISFSNGALTSQLKPGKTIGVDKLENILRVYEELSPDWLLTGKGAMLRNEQSESEQKLNEIYEYLKRHTLQLEEKLEDTQKQIQALKDELNRYKKSNN